MGSETNTDFNSVVDKNGDTLKLKYYNGMFFSLVEDRNYEENRKHVRELQCKKGDVILSTYPKSGTHWVYAILHMLLTQKTTLPENTEFLEHLLRQDKDVCTNLIATHLRLHELPVNFLKNGGKIINVVRNPKDVAVSMYHYMSKLKHEYTGRWDGFLDLFMQGKVMNGPWSSHVTELEKIALENPDCVLLLQYESLKRDTTANIKRIVDFLNLSVSDDLVKAIVEATSFHTMQSSATKMQEKFWMKQSSNYKSPIYRKGEIGDWKNFFTVKQSDEFDELFQKEMKGSSLKIQFD